MQIPDSWTALGQSVVEKPGVVLIVGKVNAGKSTLARYLAQLGSDQGRQVALVDADIGQASFGPPTCMSLTTWPLPSPHILRFIGATSPAGHLLQVVVGVKILTERALKAGARQIIIDTSGMATGPVGTFLKIHKIELVHPETLVVLQKGGELEGLLDRLPRLAKMRVHRLPFAAEARVRSPAERTAYRQGRFAEYFKEAKIRSIPLSRPRRLLLGLPLSVGRLVGLIDNAGETLGLGVVKQRDRNGVDVLTPVVKIEAVRILQGGTLKLEETWREVATIPS